LITSFLYRALTTPQQLSAFEPARKRTALAPVDPPGCLLGPSRAAVTP
jgi:hypothetical protein